MQAPRHRACRASTRRGSGTTRSRRSLLKLPTFSAPDIGNAFFGKVSIDRFQQALYWAELARHYMPPGLLPRAGPGSQAAAGRRAPRSGFPKERTWPSFLLQLGQVDFTHRRGTAQGRLRGHGAGADLGARALRQADGRERQARRAGLGHRRTRRRRDRGPSDVERARLGGGQAPRGGAAVVRHPRAAVPNRAGHRRRRRSTSLLRGDRLRGPLVDRVESGGAGRWTARGTRSDLEQVVWRVVSGLKQLDVTPQLGGTVKAPKLSVRSNLDDAIAQRLKAVVGEEVAKAEAMARAKVDSLVNDKVEPVKQRIAAVQAEATKRVADQQQQLDQARGGPAGELKRLTAGWRRGSSCRRSSCDGRAIAGSPGRSHWPLPYSRVSLDHPSLHDCGVPMRIGVPKETAPGERRVALVPESCKKLKQAGYEIAVESGAGAAAGYPDDGLPRGRRRHRGRSRRPARRRRRRAQGRAAGAGRRTGRGGLDAAQRRLPRLAHAAPPPAGGARAGASGRSPPSPPTPSRAPPAPRAWTPSRPWPTSAATRASSSPRPSSTSTSPCS